MIKLGIWTRISALDVGLILRTETETCSAVCLKALVPLSQDPFRSAPQDGIEENNAIFGNLGALTRKSFSLLQTDTTPATFWVTNPNNFLVGNTAAGSEGYGYWLAALCRVDFCLLLVPFGLVAGLVAKPSAVNVGMHRTLGH